MENTQGPAPSNELPGWGMVWSVGPSGTLVEEGPIPPPTKRGQKSGFRLTRPATDAGEPHRCQPAGAFCRLVSQHAEGSGPLGLILAVLAGPRKPAPSQRGS
jgi:hypothetical protein